MTSTALRQFDALPIDVKRRMVGIFKRLKGWPNVSGARRLSGRWTGRYRMRTGDYRVIFGISGDVVTVQAAGHRSRVYGEEA